MSESEAISAQRFNRSKWIWPESLRWDLHNSYALFRKEFLLAQIPDVAPLSITADQSYQLYINGHYVCRGPARGFQQSWPYDEVDVRRFLVSGRNIIAVRCHNPGFSNYQYLTQGYAGLLVAANWGAVSIHSDKTWRGRRQTGLNRDTVQTSAQLFCQEHIDLRQEDPRWMEPDFDDSRWTSGMAEHPWNGMPWYQLEERGLPLLDERVILPEHGIGVSQGTSDLQNMQTRDITRVRYHEGLSHQSAKFSGHTLRVEPYGEDGYRSYLLDFGKTVVGSIGFNIEGAIGGEIVDTLHVETINFATLTPHFVPDQYCRMAFGHRLICRAGQHSHTFYHAFGFRYMVVTVRHAGSGLTLHPFLRTTLYPMEITGRFHSSESDLNRIWEACAWTQRVCCLDAYVDTPWREQTQWWGDVAVQSKNTFFLSGDTRLLRRGIGQIAAQTVPNGLTYGHAPTMAHSCVLPDFSLMWVFSLWNHYWQTGSTEAFATHEKTALGVLAYCESKRDPISGLVGYDNRYWLFLDWADLFKDGYSTVYNLWLLLALDSAASLSHLLGKSSQARELESRAGELRKALKRMEQKDGLLIDGLTFDYEPVDTCSVHTQTLAILARLNEEHDQGRIHRRLLPLVRQQPIPGAQPSCYWMTYIFEVLISGGFGREVVECIRAKWRAMAAYGTTWETFTPKFGDESFSHAWSAHPLYHLMQILGGIRQIGPGWREIIYQPVFIGNDADVEVLTPLGKIRSIWRKKGYKYHVELSLPSGVSSIVMLTGMEPMRVTESKEWDLEDASNRNTVDSVAVAPAFCDLQ